jgi:hypothetical protein
LKIDGADRLYVHFNANQDIAIFAKGAHGHAAPISIVSPYNNGASSDYVSAKSGALYVLNEARYVAVYDDPLDNPSQPNRLIWPDGNFYEFSFTLVLDEAMDRLYIQFADGNPRYWNKVSYSVRPPGNDVTAHHYIFTGDCGNWQQSNVYGTVIIKKYLIESCNSSSDVLVYRTDQFGRQRKPVEIVGQGLLTSPLEMAVGP